MESSKLLRTFKGHKHWIWSVAFDPTGNILASGSADKIVNLWETASGKPLRTLEGHKDSVTSIAFDPGGNTLASGSYDQVVKLWDMASGKPLRTLEGHTDIIHTVAFSPDGTLLASNQGAHGRGRGGNVSFWRCDSWIKIASVPIFASPFNMSSLSFHSRLPLIAVVGSDPYTQEKERDIVIHIWELNLAVLLGQPAKSNVTYTNAKVVLVGESNVGKSYLAHRIATGSPPAAGKIKTTHGMTLWSLEPERLSPSAKAPEGQRRDVVLWDMGGHEEYRLIHQLFLHDTTVALVLIDPTRGTTAFKEVETWNKYLEKQLGGHTAVKLLVGTKMDKPSDTIDHKSLEQLKQQCSFKGFYESSAMEGRGIETLKEEIAKAINWDDLGKTSRPELFQRIRDEIEARRKQGEVVLHVADLHRALGNVPPTEEEAEAVDAVTKQLATQGVIARSRVSTGEPVLVLQVQEIERYAGSLIVAARDNPRNVPALELRAIAQAEFSLPGIADNDRLPRSQEKQVLECTVQLMLEHGICFQHEGLLIFPTLFAPAPEKTDAGLPHVVSLYYDFAGAIDNIYASLVAWLVLARDFGRVRLWADRAEFEMKDGGFCGLRKVARPGGFAHVDIYFEADTPEHRRQEFISFVEDHLSRNGVEIHERIVVPCPKNFVCDEETLRMRIAEGAKDVLCPRCETRHSLTEGATEARERDPELMQKTWALKTAIEKRRQKITEQAVRVINKTPEAKPPAMKPIRLLHLSDLHFSAETPVKARLQWLLDDIKRGEFLGFNQLDYVVISGDFTDKGCAEGFEKALEFVSALTHEFDLSAERCIFVPGNHDVKDIPEAFEKKTAANGTEVTVQSAKYTERFKAFSDCFYHKFLQKPYPLDSKAQGAAIPFWETGIQFLTLNSCWQIDEFNRKRCGIPLDSVANALHDAQKQEDDARKIGRLEGPLLRLAVWHHAVFGPEAIQDQKFIEHLQKVGVRIGLHGHVHDMSREAVGHWDKKHEMQIIGSGSFSAAIPGAAQAALIPRLYNLLEIQRDLKSARVHTRQQSKPDGPWDGWHEWPDPDGGNGRVPYYDIKW